MNIPGYDAWRLQGPDEHDDPGTLDGETCNRYPEPDEDAPRGWRPRRCKGTMVEHGGPHGAVVCDTCGEVA